MAADFGRSSTVLEKDVWVCWALEKLYSLPNRPVMAFKGGTALSKALHAIQRFSEDVDITIDYRSERLSRHWFDLACLADHHFGRLALINTEQLADVVRVKKQFYNSSYANYDKCLKGEMRLVPQGKFRKTLQADFAAMINSRMFYGRTPSFDAVIDRLSKLQTYINQSVPACGFAAR